MLSIWCIRERVLTNLRTTIDTVRWYVAQPAPLRRRVGVALAREADALGMSAARFRSLEDHRGALIYDPLTRELDSIVSRMTAAIAPLMTARDE